MKVLVTGGLGYIGSHTICALIANQYEVIVLDNLDNSRYDVLRSVESIVGQRLCFYQADIRNRESLNALFKQESMDAVIHFAAKKSVSEALKRPLYYYDHNINGLLTLMSLCEEYQVERFVFSSSCTVYGEPEALPVTETTPTQIATTPYGNTKRIGEELIREFVYLREGFKSIILRYFNPVGHMNRLKLENSPLGFLLI